MSRQEFAISETAEVAAQSSLLPQELREKIEEVITHYPFSKRSAALPLLHLWQNHFGFIDQSGIDWIAEKLEVNSIAILELVTFYPWFRQSAPGKKIIRVCRTLSCALAGSDKIYQQFCEKTGVDPSQAAPHSMPTSPDGRFSVEYVECLASCGSAPVCLVNKDLIERVTAEDVDKIVEQEG